MPISQNDSTPPGAPPLPPKSALELVREVCQLHLLIATALGELTELTQELAQQLDEEGSS